MAKRRSFLKDSTLSKIDGEEGAALLAPKVGSLSSGD